MRLLLDNNISPRVVARLVDLIPDARHVATVGFDRADDAAVWQYAAAHACVIVTKDADFNEFVTLRGYPPKVVWLRLGNCATWEIEQVLQRGYDAIAAFLADAEVGILVIERPPTRDVPRP